MKTWIKVLSQHQRHAFKRGRFKGDAPADPTRRWKTYFRTRLVHNADDAPIVQVIYHRTTIITYYPDGRVIFFANGWGNHPTTRNAFAHFHAFISTQRCNGYANTMIHVSGAPEARVFEDGMTLHIDSEGDIQWDAPPKKRLKFVADREARAEFRKDAAPFRAMLPLLFAAHHRTPLESRRVSYLSSTDIRRAIECDMAERYPDIVFHFSHTADTWQDVWRAVYTHQTGSMRHIVEVPVTNI